MRPVLLTMKAFGSFACETSVSFEDFRNGIFLVVGETGAGKTTVFDAIVFALFGTASGSNRKPDMLHSDYVEKSTDTEVTLAFDHGGRRYQVKRSIHFPKKRGKENEYGDGQLSALLTAPEGDLVDGHANVTKRCEELLGLDAEQFRKIVMLAQGEFREFLSADSGKKSAILGKLFDNRAYLRYQNLFACARSELDARRKMHRDSVAALMQSSFRLPENAEDSDGFLYDASNVQLVENLDRLIASDREESAALSEKKTAAQKTVDEINRRRGAAQHGNELLDELTAARERREQLEAQRPDMDRLAAQCARTEKALHKVCPQREKWIAAKKTVDDANAEIRLLRERTAGLQEQYAKAKADANADADAKARTAEIDAEQRRIAESLPRCDALQINRSALDAETQNAAALREKQKTAETQRAASREKLEAGKAELAALENADAEAVRAQTEYAQAQKDNEELNGAGGIRNGVLAVRRDEAALAGTEEALAKCTAAAAEAENAYHQKYQAFIGGQAGLMAAELKKALQSQGGARCPVCGTEHRPGEETCFAQCVEGTPTQAEVDAAKAGYERCEKARADHKNALEREKAELEHRRQALAERARKLLPDCGGWAALTAAGYPEDAAARFETAAAEAKRALDDALGKQTRKAERKASCLELEKELEALDREIEGAKTAIGEAEKKLAALRAEQKSILGSLPFETRAEAEAKAQTLAEEREALEARFREHEKALEAAKESIDMAQGELEGKEKALPQQEKAEAAAKQAYEAALSSNDFADEAALEEALAPVGDEDGDDWLDRQRESVNHFTNDRKNTAERIKTLTEQTKDLRYTDLAALEEELGTAVEQRNAADEAYAAQEALLDNHKTVRENASAALAALAKTDRAWALLDKLADLAVGSNAEGGKLSFERYVMGTIFKEVLEMANRRLDVMSGGRYSLVHSLSANRANAAAGLEIEVLDVATGKQRTASSLSGGESFQVSLSLALGLSDAVQSRAGGIGLDTIFIDEGFGTLDGSALDNAIAVLNQLTEGNRLVGIISHVDKLEESIQQKLRVKKTAKGSELKTELS